MAIELSDAFTTVERAVMVAKEDTVAVRPAAHVHLPLTPLVAHALADLSIPFFLQASPLRPVVVEEFSPATHEERVLSQLHRIRDKNEFPYSMR